MANTKISALTSATTPLAGTEVLPVVQSGATTQVSVANLTAGRAVSSLSLSTGLVTSSGTGAYFNSNLTTETGTPTNQYGLYVTRSSGAASTATNVYGVRVNTLDYATGKATTNAYGVYIGGLYATTATYGIYQSLSNNQNYFAGNIVVGTAAYGINFTANTPAAGMTSQLLNWYEEGTWTPNQGGGLTLVGAFSSTGKYTRIGREVRVSGTVTGATSVAVAAAGVITTNLPFTVGTAGHGNVTNTSVTAFAAVICTSTSITSAGAIAATGTLTFSATYFV